MRYFLKCIKKHIESKKLYVKHIHITIENNRIIYDRIIKDGQGSKIYGIEVCKALDMPIEFMKLAESIRKEVENINADILKKKKSRYNKKVIIDKCKICNNNAEETHHIVYQENADKDGYINNFHKNSKHNLVPLCKDCHKKEHNGKIKIKESLNFTWHQHQLSFRTPLPNLILLDFIILIFLNLIVYYFIFLIILFLYFDFIEFNL